MALAGRLLVLLAVALLAVFIAEHKVRSDEPSRHPSRAANGFPSDTYTVAYFLIRCLLHELKNSTRIMCTK